LGAILYLSQSHKYVIVKEAKDNTYAISVIIVKLKYFVYVGVDANVDYK